MRILHVGKYYSPYRGGLEQVVKDLCEATQKLGHIADVICIEHNISDVCNDVNGVSVVRCKSLFNAASTDISFVMISRLRKIISGYDIVHVHLPNPMANLALLFCDLSNIKVVIHWHSDIVKQKWLKKIYSPLQYWLLNRADKIIATSPSYLLGSRELQLYKNKVSIVPIGLDSSKITINVSDVSSLKNEYEGKNIVFALGRHVYYKGFKYLIESAKYLSDDYVVLIGGAGPLTDDYLNLIESLNLKEKVKLLGMIPESKLSAYFSAADVFCLPSIERSEAFGVVQLEAFSAKTPVISCNIPGSGVSWVNQDGITGIVVGTRKPKQLSEAIKEVCGPLNTKYSENAYKNFNDLFDRRIMALKTVNIYKSLFRDELKNPNI